MHTDRLVHNKDQKVRLHLLDREVRQQLNQHPANQVDQLALEALEFPLLIE